MECGSLFGPRDLQKASIAPLQPFRDAWLLDGVQKRAGDFVLRRTFERVFHHEIGKRSLRLQETVRRGYRIFEAKTAAADAARARWGKPPRTKFCKEKWRGREGGRMRRSGKLNGYHFRPRRRLGRETKIVRPDL